MSPTPVSMSDPTSPAGYSWEATSEQVAARYGVPVEEIVRFDLNTSPEPPGLAARILAAGRFETSLSEYPPSDYRRLTEAAAGRYGVPTDEILVGAGADEILDIAAKTFLPPGGTAVIPTPSYAMYRVLTEQRPARVRPVPRLGPAAGYAIDLDLTRTIARGADLVWLCSPNNPTALAEPDGAIERLLGELRADAERDGRGAPVVVLDEAYAEFTRTSLLPAREPRTRAHRRPDAEQGLRSRRPAGRVRHRGPARDRGDRAVSPPGLGLHRVGDGGHRGPGRRHDRRRGVESVERERDRLATGLARAGWRPGPSVTNFLLIDFDSPERAGRRRRGTAPRGSRSTHLRASPPAGRPPSSDRPVHAENDRLIAAASAIQADIAGADR